MDVVSLLIYRAMSGSGGQTPVATDVSYDNTTSGLLADNVQNAIDELSSEKINTSEKGTAGGVAELNENGIVLTSQLPSYVDDVLEFPTLNEFPAQGESGKIYVDLSTNRTYRWGGSSYTEISPSLALGETSSTAYRGDRGKAAYDHSQTKTGNPHNVTKAQVGLGNVDNTSDLNKPISTATQAALDTKLSEDDLYNMTEDSTVSGNPVTLKTLAKTNAKSCEVTMNPIQDLHGQSAPYPAGGGKNKFNKSAKDSTKGYIADKYLMSNGNEYSSSTQNIWFISEYKELKSSEAYTISGLSTSDSYSPAICFYDSNKEYISGLAYNNRASFSFTTPNNAAYYRLSAGIGQEYWDTIQLEEGSTATSYAPYSNICPISGRDSLILTMTGKNCFNPLKCEQGSYNSNTNVWTIDNNREVGTIYDGDFVTNTQYTFSGQAKQSAENKNIRFRIVYTDNTEENIWATNTTAIVSFNVTSNATKSVKKLNLYYGGAGGTLTVSNFQIEIGTTKTDYEAPITPTTHTATFPSTIYGGEYEFVSGKITGTKRSIIFDGSMDEDWKLQSINSYGIANFAIVEDNIKQNTDQSLCNIFTQQNSVISQTQDEGFLVAGFNTLYLRIKSTTASTVAELRTWLSNNNVQIVYPFTTPIVISLTPTDVNLLKGNNTLWTDEDSVKIVYEKLDLTELPDVTSADEGKVLTVDSSGDWIASTLPDGTNISY